MPNLYDRLGNVRDRLRHPRANRPGNGDCLRALCDHVKILRAKRRNTGNPLDFGSKQIQVQQGLARYSINDQRFGTPLAVLTIDDTNPSHIQRLIPFYCPQNLAFQWGMPNDAGTFTSGYDGSTNSAERVAFFWESGVPYLQVQPIPQAAAVYLVQFLVGNSVDAMSLSDPLSLGEVGDSLAEVRAAISLLAFTDWNDDRELNQDQRKELGVTLDWEEKLLDHQYTSDIVLHSASNIGQLWMPE